MTNLEICFNYLILKDEGSTYSNDPDDSGGPTRWGITKKDYVAFYNLKMDETDNEVIEGMPASVAKQIYSAKYWLPLSCDLIQDLGFACTIFDSGVLYGIGTIGLMAQRTLASLGVPIKLDGKFGDKSAELLNQFLGGGAPSRQAFMSAFQNLIRERIGEIIAEHPKDEKYRHGWTLRADRLSQLLDPNYLNQFNKEIFT